MPTFSYLAQNMSFIHPRDRPRKGKCVRSHLHCLSFLPKFTQLSLTYARSPPVPPLPCLLVSIYASVCSSLNFSLCRGKRGSQVPYFCVVWVGGWVGG